MNDRVQFVLVGSSLLGVLVGFLGGTLVGRATAPSCDVCPQQRGMLTYDVGKDVVDAKGKMFKFCEAEVLAKTPTAKLVSACGFNEDKSRVVTYDDGTKAVFTDCTVAECIERNYGNDASRRRRLQAGKPVPPQRRVSMRCPNDAGGRGTGDMRDALYKNGFTGIWTDEQSVDLLDGKGVEVHYYKDGKKVDARWKGKDEHLRRNDEVTYRRCQYQADPNDPDVVLTMDMIEYEMREGDTQMIGVMRPSDSTKKPSTYVRFERLFGAENRTSFLKNRVWSEQRVSTVGSTRPRWFTYDLTADVDFYTPDADEITFIDHRDNGWNGRKSDKLTEFMMNGQRLFACCPPIDDEGMPSLSMLTLSKDAFKAAVKDEGSAIRKTFQLLESRGLASPPTA